MKKQNHRLSVCPSHSTTYMIVLEAQRLAQSGETIDGIIGQIFDMSTRSEVFIVFDTLFWIDPKNLLFMRYMEI